MSNKIDSGSFFCLRYKADVDKDNFVSMNADGVIGPGSFDPTSGCVEKWNTIKDIPKRLVGQSFLLEVIKIKWEAETVTPK